jgi:hypothetical protein
LGTHPLVFHAELYPQREEEENKSDEPAHLGEGIAVPRSPLKTPV